LNVVNTDNERNLMKESLIQQKKAFSIRLNEAEKANKDIDVSKSNVIPIDVTLKELDEDGGDNDDNKKGKNDVTGGLWYYRK